MIIDAESLDEYKPEYGQSLVTAHARIGGLPVGVVAGQRQRVRPADRGNSDWRRVYSDCADKGRRGSSWIATRSGLPIIFLQDVTGFMVGLAAEQSGISRSGAKLVNAVSNSIVPKFTIVIGGSFGAGNYALCGRAYDPRIILRLAHARLLP